MSILSKYNTGRKFDYEAPKDSSWVKLDDLVQRDGMGAVYPLNAMYVNNKSKFGTEPVLISGSFLINAPRHLLTTVQDMMNDDDVVKYINDGHVAFSIYQYEGKNGKGYSVRWVDEADKD